VPQAGAFQPASAGSKQIVKAAPDLVAPEKLREDFRILRSALEQGHPGIYRYTPKQELDHRFDQADRALDRPMNVYQFYRTVAPVVAALKCGHTGVRVSPDLDKAKPRLPLVVRLLDGKIYVLRDLSDSQAALAGQQIRAINGLAADQIVQTLLAAVPADGDVQTARLQRIGGSTFTTELIDLLGLESPYMVTLWDAKQGREHSVHLQGVDVSKLEQPRPKESATLAFFDDGKIADLKVHRFGGTAGKKDLAVFFHDSFAEMAQKKSTALILDLRENGGGADELGKLLLSFLIDEPFRYYDDLVAVGQLFDFELVEQKGADLGGPEFLG
jgi:C-terminal processing protease CtpA/Prc